MAQETRWTFWSSTLQVLIGIISLILAGLALPIGELFDQPAASFEWEGALPLQKVDQILRQQLQENELSELPNVIHPFRFRNLSSSRNIEGLRYIFTAPGVICERTLLRGTEHLTKPRWEPTNDPRKVTLVIDQLPPRVMVTGVLCYRTLNPFGVRIEKPEASAYRLHPEKLVLPEDTPTGSTLRWIITAGIWIIAGSMLMVWQMRKSRDKEIVEKACEELHIQPEVLVDKIKDLKTSAPGDIAHGDEVKEKVCIIGRKGKGKMYWYNPPTGWLSYEEGFEALAPALENREITEILFILDDSVDEVKETWCEHVLDHITKWYRDRKEKPREDVSNKDKQGHVGKVRWIFRDLHDDLNASFKLLIDEKEKLAKALIFLRMDKKRIGHEDRESHEVQVPDVALYVEGNTNTSIFLNELRELAEEFRPLLK